MLEDERKQLNAKIEKYKKANASDQEFETLLKATNRLRLQQDEEVGGGGCVRLAAARAAVFFCEQW